MSGLWSQQIAAQYHLQLPADLAAWLDDDVWRRVGGAEFNRPQSPPEMLAPEAGTLWGGFMLPDTLPLVGNRYGDWLCLRAAPDGQVREIIYWSHAGGDWIPYGRTLAEALVYDVAFRLLYPQRPELAEPEPATDEVFALAEWALPWIGPDDCPLEPFWRQPPPDGLLARLLHAGVAEVAVRRDRLLRHLETKLKAGSDPQLAREIGTRWEPDFVSWLFDTSLIPELRKEDLSRRFDLPIGELMVQDWDAAETEALEVARRRQDLGWPLDIAGWAAERRGDIELAVERYAAGARASLFADESVRFRTHWFAEGYGKFSAARLAELRDQLPRKLAEDPYLRIFWANDPESLRARVRDYWVDAAHAAQRRGEHLQAYRAFYNAGWDLGLQYLRSYRGLLDQLAEAAQAADAPALAALARLHRQFV